MTTMKTLLPLLALLWVPQDVAWKKTWPEALQAAAKEKKLAVLVFFNDGVKDWQRFKAEGLKDGAVIAALNKHACALVDPEGSDDDNRLWQKMGSKRPPITYLFTPDGNLLVEV